MKTPESPEISLFARIADALERLAPAPAAIEALPDAPAYAWDHGTLRPVATLSAQPLDRYVGIDAQREALLRNTERLAKRLPAHDILLWGSRGMGKSSLVKSAVSHLQAAGEAIALVEIERDDIADVSLLLRRLAELDRAFVLFCDDLSFDTDERQYRRLRSVLEGGIEARPDNCRFYVTSNRRHIVPREMRENELANSINARDVLDDRLALADRFGLSLGFHACDQTTYLAMVDAYGRAYGLDIDPLAAVTWATGRGGRSGRVAWQYVQEVAGAAGVRLG
ncbi:MAG: ATP-binding protein [Pseudomonadota bacterium]|jgi:predicted AAA+ superfamily ATPase|nr:ATP-binding protein [Pseudomonadota bacterium]